MTKKFNFSLFLVIAIFCIIQTVYCSSGDRSNAFQNCMHWCSIKNCTNSSSLAKFEATRPWYLSFLLWDCWDECDHFCMWHTVKVFLYHGEAIPQFHGKWPFYRFCGLQEPASVFFSILNGISHYGMWIKFQKAVPECPFRKLWNVQALAEDYSLCAAFFRHFQLSINAWFWSAVFHARDTPITEKLDYYCAFSLVLYSFYSLFVRLYQSDKSWMPLTIAVPFLSYFCYHIYYLSFVHFDYGYNLKVNIFVGLLNSIGWIFWCYKHRHKNYIWKCAASVIVVNLLLLLELWDFPPWKFLIDAHALWHMGTIPVPLLWYSFLIEDCLNEINCLDAMKKIS